MTLLNDIEADFSQPVHRLYRYHVLRIKFHRFLVKQSLESLFCWGLSLSQCLVDAESWLLITDHWVFEWTEPRVGQDNSLIWQMKPLLRRTELLGGWMNPKDGWEKPLLGQARCLVGMTKPNLGRMMFLLEQMKSLFGQKKRLIGQMKPRDKQTYVLTGWVGDLQSWPYKAPAWEDEALGWLDEQKPWMVRWNLKSIHTSLKMAAFVKLSLSC